MYGKRSDHGFDQSSSGFYKIMCDGMWCQLHFLRSWIKIKC